jgi:hypothetical protein
MDLYDRYAGASRLAGDASARQFVRFSMSEKEPA